MSLKNLLRKFQDRIEADFAAQRHLVSFGPNELVRMEVTEYKGPAVVLPWGSVLPGAVIGDIHLNSTKLAGFFQDETREAIKKRLALFREVQKAFQELAIWLEEDPRGLEISAISSLTLLDKELQFLGFTLVPLPFWPWVIYGVYMQYLNFLYRAKGTAAQSMRRKAKSIKKGNLLVRYVPKQAWMSREKFLEKYSPQRR